MMEKIFDAILALIFTAFTVFSAPAIYNFVKRESLIRVSKGLSPMAPFQRALDPTDYDWDRESQNQSWEQTGSRLNGKLFGRMPFALTVIRRSVRK